MSNKTTILLADSNHPMPVGVYVLFGVALLALSLGLAYLNYMSGIAIIDLQRLPDSLKDMRKLQLALVISACILLLVMGALYTPDHFGRVYLTWAVTLAFCLEGYEALVYYQAAQSASQISHSAATGDASRIANLEGQIAAEESTASTADALALRNGRSDIVASRQTADAQQASARAARNRAATLRQQLGEARSKQAAPSDEQIFGTWTTTINMVKALLLFLLSVTMSGFAGRNLRFAYAAHLRAAAAAALEEHAKTGKVPTWMARRGLTPAAVALALGMGAAGAQAATAQPATAAPSPASDWRTPSLAVPTTLPTFSLALPTQASQAGDSLAYAGKADDKQGTLPVQAMPQNTPETATNTPKNVLEPQKTATNTAQQDMFAGDATALPVQARQADDKPTGKAKQARPRIITAVPDGDKRDTGVAPGSDSRYQRVRADIKTRRINPSVPAIKQTHGGSNTVAQRYLQAMHAAGELEATFGPSGALTGYKLPDGQATI